MKLFLDIETFSTVDVTKYGVYGHAESPQFEILMMAYALDDEPVKVALGQDEVLRVIRPYLGQRDVTKIAHNAMFERVCFSRALWPGDPSKFLSPETWDDSMALAGVWGYPQGLEKLAVALETDPKDSAGKALIRLFCTPRRDGGRNTAESHPAEWLEFTEYCAQDVETMRQCYQTLRPWPTPAERRVWEVDQYINDQGMRLDVPMARRAEQQGELVVQRAKAEVTEITGGAVANAGSVQQLHAWFTDTGLPLPDFQRETVGAVLASDRANPAQRRVLELRQELALAAVKKYTAALGQVSRDGRLRGAFRYFGAHTGRWAGRGIQPQNLPREQFKLPVDESMAIIDLMNGEDLSTLDLKRLVRSMFVGPFTVVDFKSIEALVLAWLADEQWTLDAFRAGRDIYVETAERMSTPSHPLDRSQGKVAVLALGYNGAVGSLRNMGADGTDQELVRLVTQWRAANPNIVAMWAELDYCFKHGGTVGEFINVERDGDSRYIWLPSGRAIAYHGFKTRLLLKPGWSEPRPVMTFKDPKRIHPWIDTYGGRLTENVTQAVARDLLAAGLVRLWDNRHTVVGHVHDEVICESPNTDLVSKLFCAPVPWAEGLPVMGEASNVERYRK